PVHPVQQSELLQHEEQEEHHGAARNEEILPQVPQAPGAQGNQVDWNQVAVRHRRRGVGLTADQRSPKPRVGVRIPPPLPTPESRGIINMASIAETTKPSTLESMKQWPEITRNYVADLQLEMKRVTWPTRAQVQATTA